MCCSGDDERQAAVKRARQQSGLHFGTYNAVIQSYEVGRQRALREGAEMRLHGFDGTGRITQQIIRKPTARTEPNRAAQSIAAPNESG